MKDYWEPKAEPKCYRGTPPCEQGMNHTGHHDDGSHRWSLRVNGLRHCYDCPAEDYDPTWGGGIFSDWPRGERKPYGD